MMHMSSAMDEIHEGKFGFVINNYLSLTPMDNRWTNDWSEFLARRMSLLLRSLFEPKVYARAPFKKDESSELINLTEKLIGSLKDRFADVPVKPSLLHGDLWIGNAGFTKDKAVVYDPACFFGHSEMDLAIMELFGGFTDKFYNAYHSRIPKAEGFEERSKIYKVYHYLNQLNLFGNEQVKVEVIKLLRELVES
uniref:protein-ribulosamine 3-kinase n=2 Tax=Rhodosorus marinus TaxID=101924 RepID=A0A7S2ZPU7_9RHOD|mmetsp:Transcript_25785/g.101759  ORF Transcript_25785/g.101759 Transcript_25785/m.101759 type:complete len:194 (+) Transcript_25785:596-1177(+)